MSYNYYGPAQIAASLQRLGEDIENQLYAQPVEIGVIVNGEFYSGVEWTEAMDELNTYLYGEV